MTEVKYLVVPLDSMPSYQGEMTDLHLLNQMNMGWTILGEPIYLPPTEIAATPRLLWVLYR